MYGKYDGHIFPYCMYLYVVSFQGVIIRPRGAGHDDTLDCALCHYAIHSDLGSLDIQKSAECAVGFIPHHVCVCVEIVYNIVLSYEYAYIIMLKVCLICCSIHYIFLYIEFIYIYMFLLVYTIIIYIYISIYIYIDILFIG